ncbi:response regulator [Caballeronia sp. RCC_10]|uniref:hybrid sensor histidine kinase/response regulator n=1 Tax=Caballeronia sp. RCC_10 TaxID=3239227 RepID=UPI003525610C
MPFASGRDMTTQQSASAPASISIGQSHFRRMRAAFVLALALSVLGPCVFLAVFGWQDWQDRLSAARDTTERSTYIAKEHAQKVFDIDAALAERVIDTLEDRKEADLRRDRTFYDVLARLVRGHAQVDGVSVWTADGQLGATSLRFPAPDISIADRVDFIDARTRPTQLYVSGPMKGRVTGNATFNVMKHLVRHDGLFAGLVSISMSSAYFEDFYRQLADDKPLTIGMIRSDGAVLAWSPGPHGRPERISRDTAFFRLLASGHEAGVVTMVSTVDGEEKILAFRRVGDYDAYVTAGFPLRYIWTAWLARFTTVTIATLVPSAALFVLLIFSLRRLRHEESLWRRAETEASMRASLEAAAKEHQHLETLGNMVALVAHDFNNLLMAIVGYAHAALRADPRPHSDSVSAPLKGIMATVERGQRLTRRLLSVSKKHPVRPERLSSTNWSSHVDLLRSAVGEGVAIEASVHDGLWDIDADQAELELALLNIAINARDAMGGRGRLHIVVSNANVSREGNGSGTQADFVRIDMTDSGAGIDPATAERAFEPFFTTKAPGHATGLGLAQVRSFCELSGGHCSIGASPRGGTLVSLFLPRSKSPNTSPLSGHLDSAGVAASSPCIRLLLVEDDPMVADAQAAMFSAFEYEVTHAANADDAYRLLRAPHNFEAVISDVQMPGSMDGLDLAEHLQREQPNLPLIMLTGFVDQAERLRGSGITTFLKPIVDVAVLDELIRRRVTASNAACASQAG